MRKATKWTLALLVGSVLLTGCQRVEGWFGSDVDDIEGDDPRTRQIKKLAVDLQADDPQVQQEAAEQLGRMQADQDAVLDALEEVMREDSNEEVRAAAARALRQIGGYDAYSRLSDAAADGYPQAREEYAAVVQELRGRARRGDSAARDVLRRLGEKYVQ